MVDMKKHLLLDALSGREDIDGDKEQDGKKDEADSKDQGSIVGKVADKPKAQAKGQKDGTDKSFHKGRNLFAVDGRKKAQKAIKKGDSTDDDDEHPDKGIHGEEILDEAEDTHGNQGRGEDAFRPDDALVLHEAGKEIDKPSQEQRHAEDDIDDLGQGYRAAKKDADGKEDDSLEKKHCLLVGLYRDRVFFLWHFSTSYFPFIIVRWTRFDS